MATYQEQIEANRRKREAREKADAERKAKELTPDQVRHWRDVLGYMGVPFAHSMPVEMVQQFKDAMQTRIANEFSNSSGEG